MAKVLIVYGSTTGNTEWVAETAAARIKEAGHKTEVLEAGQAKADGLCRGWDLVLFGCSTWGQDDIELQEDFAILFESFDKIEAKGVKTAVFGCGDESFTYFCGAVDAIADKLESLGAEAAGYRLKIDGDPHDSDDEISSWLDSTLSAVE
jgi:flavodoxin short chain